MQSLWKWRIRTLRRDSTAAAVVLSASDAGDESGRGGHTPTLVGCLVEREFGLLVRIHGASQVGLLVWEYGGEV